MAAAWIEEPQSGVSYKLAGDDLINVIRKAVDDDDWQFITFGGSIVLRRFPRSVRREGGSKVGAQAVA